MDCKTCKENRAVESVPYIVHESAMARGERRERRWLIALVMAIVFLFASNAAWLYAWNQYDYSSEEYVYSQDGAGSNIIGNGNEVHHGAENSRP